ncbi:MAG: primosomal protein N' [Lachnospiraceae bacterium]|nr:primosomal protein N' [Lachnospiraceae bacterium]
MTYADIIIGISHEKLDHTFQYRVRDELAGSIVPGAYVEVPFGNGGRVVSGYVVGLSEKPKIDESRIRDVIGLSAEEESGEPQARLVKLAAWMKQHYGGTMIQSLKCVLPVKSDQKPREKLIVHLLLEPEEAEKRLFEFRTAHQNARARLLEALMEAGTLDMALISQKLNITKTVVNSLEKRGIVRTESVPVYRNPAITGTAGKGTLTLTEAQSRIVSDFLHRYGAGDRKPSLIHGVTGSGKTELYIRMIEGVVRQGKQAIMLIPEIALTYQTVVRFYARFGDRVSYLHSRLTRGERYDQFLRAKRGELDVMIGPRSALFTPFADLGIIIMDEEHETSYKSEATPKYHARETAIRLAELSDAAFVMGSATPSMDAYYHAQNGDYRLYEMKERVGAKGEVRLPTVYTVDLREELKRGNRSVFSGKLYSLMEDRLSKGEQIMLFLNRRGYAGFISCRKCGFIYKCPHCDVSLVQHKDGKLTCHYCGFRTDMVKTCPECGSRYIGGMKAGTEQIEQSVRKEFPGARTLRMDMDTTKEAGNYEKILSSFANEEADILIGTQMIVKGHDFPNVTLMGILVADMSLYANDYRAGERTFQLLTQAAGRAGRAGKPGEVVIQTYSPEHFAVVHAAAQDYGAFYRDEIAYRELCGYPPVMHLLSVLAEDYQEEAAQSLIEKVDRIASGFPVVRIGPADAAISRIKDMYRKQLFLKSGDYELLTRIKDAVEEMREQERSYRGRLEFDFDPA